MQAGDVYRSGGSPAGRIALSAGVGANNMVDLFPRGQHRAFYPVQLEIARPIHAPPTQHRSLPDIRALRARLADFYSPIGQQSIDPELILRLLDVSCS